MAWFKGQCAKERYMIRRGAREIRDEEHMGEGSKGRGK